MDLMFHIHEDVKPEITEEVSLLNVDDPSYYVWYQNNIKKECSQADLNTFVKQELPDLEYDYKGDKDSTIKPELINEELDIKAEILLSSHEDQAVKKPTRHKLYQCSLCNYNSTWKSNLQDHIKTHTGEKPLQCDICNYKCIQKGSLQRHIRKHTGVKPFKCSICDYKFSQNSSLQRHIKVHNREKLLQCNSSVQKNDLQRHMKLNTGEKPFKCNVCDCKFTRNYYLKQHVKTHMGDKPFKCNVCDYKSIQKSNLQRHMKTHTGKCF